LTEAEGMVVAPPRKTAGSIEICPSDEAVKEAQLRLAEVISGGRSVSPTSLLTEVLEDLGVTLGDPNTGTLSLILYRRPPFRASVEILGANHLTPREMAEVVDATWNSSDWSGGQTWRDRLIEEVFEKFAGSINQSFGAIGDMVSWNGATLMVTWEGSGEGWVEVDPEDREEIERLRSAGEEACDRYYSNLQSAAEGFLEKVRRQGRHHEVLDDPRLIQSRVTQAARNGPKVKTKVTGNSLEGWLVEA
jgi:hypothetical protein